MFRDSAVSVVLMVSLWACGSADPTPQRDAIASDPTVAGTSGSSTAIGSGNVAISGFAGAAASGSLPGVAGSAASSGLLPFPVGGTSGAVITPVGGVAGAGVGQPIGVTPPPGAAGSAAAPPGTAAPAGAADPIIPMVAGDCPMWTNGTITFSGLSGIQIAAGAKPASATAPMLFYWHGTGSTSGEYAFMATQVANGVTAAGGVIVSFQGTTGGDGLSGTSIFGAGDFKLADQLLACAVKDHNIDPRKVYVTGCSAGGLFSIAMAQERSNYIAAAASNSGGESFPAPAQGKHIPPIMCVHGKMGTDVVGIDFAQASATAEKAFKAAGASIVIDCDTGGMHCGGGGFAPDIWAFFQAHTYGVSPEPWAGGLPATINKACIVQ